MINVRRENVFKQIKDQSVVILYSGKAPKKSADQFYPYEVNRNFYYLSHIDQADTYLVLIKGANQEKSFLFTEPFDALKALWVGSSLSFEEAKKLSGVDKVYSNKDFYSTLAQFLSASRAAAFGTIKHIYVDLERISFDDDKLPSEHLAKVIQTNYPNLEVENIHPILSHLRTVKDQTEVEKIKKAIEITKEGIEGLLKASNAGLFEYQLEAYYNFVLNMKGVTPSFNTIAASGKNATVLHYEDNNDVINDGELILFDLGVSYDKYCSDISRTFPVNGKFTDRQKQIYEIVLNCNKKVIEFLKPGITNIEFNNYAKELLADDLIKIGLIDTAEELSKYYYHSIGHHLGLDVHDVGDYTVPFKEGQILTVEPGLYIAEENIGIRIEDNILLTKDGNINLSQDIIKEVKEIEAFMKK